MTKARLPEAESKEKDAEHVREMNDHPRKMEEAVEQCHVAAKATQNPIYAWQAIMYRWWQTTGAPRSEGEQPKDLVIPGWCADYIGNVAQTLSFLADGFDFRQDPAHAEGAPAPPLDEERAYELLPTAMGFTRRGFSAFKNRRADFEGIRAFAKLNELQKQGLSYDDALVKLKEVFPAKEESVLRKKTTRGRRLVGHLSMHTGKT